MAADGQGRHRGGSLAQSGAQTVGSGVSAADDDDVLAGRIDELARVRRRGRLGRLSSVRRHEVVHGEFDSVESASRQLHIAGHGGTGGHQHRVEPGLQSREVDIAADFHAGFEPSPLGTHLRQPAVDMVLLEFEVRDPVAQQPAEAVLAFEDDDGVPGPGQLLCRGESRRPGTDDGDGVPGDPVGDDRGDESGGESVVDDGDLDLFDRHGRLVDAEDAGVLTGGRAGPTGEFGEVVRRVEQLHGTRQLPAVHGVVELRNEIAQGASLMAERHSAVHAA